MRTFSWCEIVGKRFPICHVHVEDTIVGVCHFPLIQIADFFFSLYCASNVKLSMQPRFQVLAHLDESLIGT